MDSVALFLSRDYTLSIIQALRESKEKCNADGREIMAKKYQEIERLCGIKSRLPKASGQHGQERRVPHLNQSQSVTTAPQDSCGGYIIVSTAQDQ